MMPAWWSASHCRQSRGRSGPESTDHSQSAPPHPNSWPEAHRRLVKNIKEKSLNQKCFKQVFKHSVTRTLMLFLKVYPGKEKPFFLSIGSLKMTSCSNRKTLLSFALDGKPLSGSLTEKVSCWSSFPWAVIFPWNSEFIINIVTDRKSPWVCVPSAMTRQEIICISPQIPGACPHSSCHYSALARNTSPPPPSEGRNGMEENQ